MTEPNWYPDPTGRFEVRYYDGAQWTAHVATAGVAGTDPLPDVQETVAVSNPTTPPGFNPDPFAPVDSPVPTSPPAAGPPPGFGSSPGQEGWPPAESPSRGNKGVVGLLAVLGAVAASVVVGAFLLLSGDDDSDPVEVAAASGEEADDESGDGGDGGAASSSTTNSSTTNSSTTVSTTTVPTTAMAASITTTTVPTTAAPATDDPPPPTDAREVILEYGSDPELDVLADDCQAGDMSACDALFFQSDVDSGYEAYGDSCGGRNRPAGFCVSIYPE